MSPTNFFRVLQQSCLPEYFFWKKRHNVNSTEYGKFYQENGRPGQIPIEISGKI